MFSTKLDRVANRYCPLILSKTLQNGKGLELILARIEKLAPR